MADAADVAAVLTTAAAGRKKTIVDLADLAFIDCSGAGALARAQRRAQQVGGRLLLAAPQPRVRRVFELSRLIDDVSIHASVEQATGSDEVSGPAAVPRPGVLSLSRVVPTRTGGSVPCPDRGRFRIRSRRYPVRLLARMIT